jgi:hypothetical protein
MNYARIVDSVVFEVFTPPTGFTIDDCFTAEIVAQFQPCADEVEGGWLVEEDGSLVAPSPLPVPPVDPITVEATEVSDNTLSAN